MTEQQKALIEYTNTNYIHNDKFAQLGSDMLDFIQKIDSNEITTTTDVDNWFNG
tara:strand:- start:148 stop:309 length:162 start_codon:yes stop_codon:yes gene_type:complete